MSNQVALQKLRDPKYYLENFTKIKVKEGGLDNFILNEAQKDLFNTLRKDTRVMILKARQIGFCFHPDTKILRADLTWTTIDKISVGDKVVSIDEEVYGGRGSSRKMQTAVVENKSNIVSNAVSVTLDDGRILKMTSGHKMLCKVRGVVHTEWRQVNNMKIGDEIRHIINSFDDYEQTFEDGWVAGMIDGEGCLRMKKNSGVELTISQVDGLVWDRLVKYFDNNNYSYRIEVDKRTAGDSSKLGSKPVNKIVLNKMDELFELLGKTRSSRFRNVYWWIGKKLPNNGWSKIVDIQKLPKQRMIDLQTSEKTYIADGFVSHNSTAVTGFFYHDAITRPGITTALVGYNSDMVAELLDKVKTFYRTTPTELQPSIHYNSKYEISFPKLDSKILVLSSTENVGRGYTIHNCLITELAMIDKADEKMTALENSVPISGRIVVESTPKGQGNRFHRMWMGDNDYTKKEYGWWWHYSKEQIAMIKRRMNDDMRFAQEYGLTFLASGRSVFDQNKIRDHRKHILREGDLVKDGDAHHNVTTRDQLRIYKQPKPDDFYVFGVDVAEGVRGGDYNAAHVWNRMNGEEVAMFRGHIPPDKFGEKLNIWGRWYNNALMVVETNNHGLTTVTKLKELGYPSMYFRPSQFDEIASEYSSKLGWKTTRVTRPLLIDDFNQAFNEGSITIHSKELLDEMSVFIYDDNGKMIPQQGFHDDCLKKGTLIKTINGYVEIEKIKPGDLVLTHKGRYRRVEKCLEKPFSGDWYNLNINGQLNLELSYNHPIYVATGKYKRTTLINHSKRQWKLPNKLLKSYKPISIIEKFNECKNKIINGTDNKWGFGKKNIDIIFNKDFAKFLGLFLAEGNCRKNSNQMSLAFHERDIELLNEISSYIRKLNIHVHERHCEEMYCRVLYFTSKTLCQIMRACYDKDGEKQFPYWYNDLGNNLIYALEYWLKGDGWYDDRGVYNKIGATTSKKLALMMRDIAWSADYYAIIHKVKRHRYEVENKDQYYVSVKYTKNKNQHLQQLSKFEYGGKIHNINKEFYNGTVYNLQIEEDKSFVADGVVVHNCIFSAGIGLQGFKIMYDKPLKQINYDQHLPGYAY